MTQELHFSLTAADTLLIFGRGYCVQRLLTLPLPVVPVVVSRSVPPETAVPPSSPENLVRFVRKDLSDCSLHDLELLPRQGKVVLLDSIPPGEGGSVSSNLLIARFAKTLPSARVIYLSSTSVYEGNKPDEWVDESWLAEPQSGKGIQRRTAERSYESSGVPTIALRLSGIYGPGRGLGIRLRRGDVIEGPHSHFTNRIHVADIASTLQRLCVSPPALPRWCALNLTDNEPVRWDELVEHYRVLTKCRPNWRGSAHGRSLIGKRVSNRRITDLLGAGFLRYPTFREGCLHEGLAPTENAP
jgi:hypothetical protein